MSIKRVQTVSVAANAARWGRDNSAFLNDNLHASGTAPIYDSMARFEGIAVPKSAVILLAQLFETPYAVAGAPSCTIFAEDADSGVLIDTAAKGISAVAAKTTANTAAGTWTVDTEKIINVKTIIEEITTRAGWVNGGNINMLYVNTGASGTYVWDNSVVARGFLRLTIIFVADRSPVMMF